MGEISVHESVTIASPAENVLDLLYDIGGQSTWWPGQYLSEVLETDEDGYPVRARLGNDVKVVKEEFEVVYDYPEEATGYSWTLVSPTMSQRAQRGTWTVTPRGSGCEARIDLVVEPLLPLPGFVLRKVVTDAIKGSLKALKARAEST